jgi:hypothetical protein
MSVSSKTCLRIAGTGLALAVALPGLALAQAAATPTPVTATAGQMVTRDASTGELRMPTAEEARALQATKSTRGVAAAARTLPKVHATGAQGARLTDDFMSYTAVVRRADGTLVNQHFSSKEEAEAAVKSPAPLAKPATAPTE